MSTPQEMPLPPGAKMLDEPRTVKIGPWVPIEVDAEMMFAGVKWYRAKEGFGHERDYRTGALHHPREDWIADLPVVSAHVGRWLSDPDDWKGDGATIQEAMPRALARTLDMARHKRGEAEAEMLGLQHVIRVLSKAVAP